MRPPKLPLPLPGFCDGIAVVKAADEQAWVEKPAAERKRLIVPRALGKRIVAIDDDRRRRQRRPVVSSEDPDLCGGERRNGDAAQRAGNAHAPYPLRPTRKHHFTAPTALLRISPTPRSSGTGLNGWPTHPLNPV